MNKEIKNYLGIAVTIFVIVLIFVSTSYAINYSKVAEPSSFRSFSVTGEGETVIIPDIAQFSFTVITEGGTEISDLQSQNTEKMNNAIEFVKASGVEEKDIKTASYNLTPRYKYCTHDDEECPPPEIVGYTISQSVLIKIRDFGKIGGLLSGIIENGANSVSQLSFTIDDPTEAKSIARAEAIKKAQEQANEIAEAGGFKIGKLLSVDEYAPYLYGKGGGGLEVSFMDEAGGAPTIEPGSQEVTVNVTLRYQIK